MKEVRACRRAEAEVLDEIGVAIGAGAWRLAAEVWA
jgi:hypothetical protein